MEALPTPCAHRLAQALARQRRLADEQLLQVAYGAGPFNRVVPLFMVRQRMHDFTGALLATLRAADFRILYNYMDRMVRYSRDQGRPVHLSHALTDSWDTIMRDLAASEFATEPDLQAEAAAMTAAMVAATHALVDAIYSGEEPPPG